MWLIYNIFLVSGVQHNDLIVMYFNSTYILNPTKQSYTVIVFLNLIVITYVSPYLPLVILHFFIAMLPPS